MPTKRKKLTPPPPAAPGYVEIASRAYAIFLERGGAHGFDREDWLQAERELLAAQS